MNRVCLTQYMPPRNTTACGTMCIRPEKNPMLVPMAGDEPARLSPLPPQDSVSTNSTTSAWVQQKLQ